MIFEYCKREYLTLGSLFAIFEPWIWRRLGPVPACFFYLEGKSGREGNDDEEIEDGGPDYGAHSYVTLEGNTRDTREQFGCGRPCNTTNAGLLISQDFVRNFQDLASSCIILSEHCKIFHDNVCSWKPLVSSKIFRSRLSKNPGKSIRPCMLEILEEHVTQLPFSRN